MGEGRGHQGTPCRFPVLPHRCHCCKVHALANKYSHPNHASQVLMAWSDERVVISFRGTASWQNVLADMQFWLTGALLFIGNQQSSIPGAFYQGVCRLCSCTAAAAVLGLLLQGRCCPRTSAPGHETAGACACAGHPPIRGRGNWLCGTRPHVHAGFLRSWQANGLNQKLLKRIRGIVYSATPKGKLPRQTVYVTGDAASGQVINQSIRLPAFSCAGWAYVRSNKCEVSADITCHHCYYYHHDHGNSMLLLQQATAWAAAWLCWQLTTSPRGCRR